MTKILIVEDESGIVDNIVYALKTEGFEAHWVGLGASSLDVLVKQDFDLLILDVGLPDMSGFEVCKKVRIFSDIPIIFLTARNEEVDRIVGLEIGGDDYVSKPFSPRELVARVKVILKRTKRSASLDEKADDLFEIIEDKAKIYYLEQALELTRYEYLLLRKFISQPERVFSRDQLMEEIWSSPASSLDRSIDTHIKSLRSKFRVVDSSNDPIKTHRGLGYSIVVRHEH